ncbi:hypothetical protein [Vibrio sp. 10N.239.312.D08]|uniref:hypothetical protein n=1 Tax=Vibrio sp. 10N.239.312.D08 TaxID=3229978 RepID=UPI00354C63E3
MQTNTISITEIAPHYSGSNIDSIKDRVKALHPRLNDDAVESYICDLLDVNCIEDITVDFLTYEEVEPAVSTEELHFLAHRILPYNDNDLSKSIYAVRNILNTIPRSTNDLVDYITPEALKEWTDALSLCLVMNNPESIKNYGEEKTLKSTLSSLQKVDQTIIDLVCSTEMDRVQAVAMEEHPGLTYRQKMLFVTAHYWLNHKAGFKLNTMWLASFIHSDRYGCSSGWFHLDGELCGHRNFGFKNESEVVDLVIESYPAIEAQLAADPSNPQSSLFIDTILSAWNYLLIDDFKNSTNNTDKLNQIAGFIGENISNLSAQQNLRYISLNCIRNGYDGLTKVQFNALNLYLQDESSRVDTPNEYLMYHDLYNFCHFAYEVCSSLTLPVQFQRCHFDPSALREVTQTLLSNYDKFEKKDLPIVNGFFKNYLWYVIQFGSNDQFTYDAVMEACIKSQNYVDNIHLIFAMAELGHLGSMKWTLDNNVGSKSTAYKYWMTRIEYLQQEGSAEQIEVYKQKTLPFYPLVDKIQRLLGNTADIMHLLNLLPESDFLILRMQVIEAFEVGTMPSFNGEYDDEVELGDVSDAIIGVTLNTYPQGTPRDKPIDYNARKQWCSSILKSMDHIVQAY